MMSGTLICPEPAEQPEVGARRAQNPLSPKTTLERQRIVGTLAFLALFGVFFSQNRFPKLDIVRARGDRDAGSHARGRAIGGARRLQDRRRVVGPRRNRRPGRGAYAERVR